MGGGGGRGDGVKRKGEKVRMRVEGEESGEVPEQ